MFEMAKGGEEHVRETLGIGGTHKRDYVHAFCNKSKWTRLRPVVEGPSHLLLKNFKFRGGFLSSCNREKEREREGDHTSFSKKISMNLVRTCTEFKQYGASYWLRSWHEIVVTKNKGTSPMVTLQEATGPGHTGTGLK